MERKFYFFILVLVLFGKIVAQTSFYGVTEGGGVGQGTIFRTDASGNNHTIVFNKFFANVANTGRIPQGTLLHASNGLLYGMTSHGGNFDVGVIYSFDLQTNSYTKKIDLSNTLGSFPNGSLIEATNGNIYGMTSQGGSENKGVIFEYDPILNKYSKLVDFNDNLGSYPTGSLIQAKDGKLYGMTSGGGGGIIFMYDIDTKIYTKKINLSSIDASFPEGSLMEASNGLLYGMTSAGGKFGLGVLFSYNYKTNFITKVFEFDKVNGATPKGDLMQASNQKLFGMTTAGGIKDKGVLFEFDISGSKYLKIIDFDDEKGSKPTGTLIQGKNGKLYGTTSQGGSFVSGGVLFEYDMLLNSYEKKVIFTGSNGQIPSSGKLIEINNITLVEQFDPNLAIINLYPNPAKEKVVVESNYFFESLQVVDINNRVVMQKANHKDKIIEIDILEIPTGVYMLRLFTSGNVKNVIIEKMIIQN